MKNLFANEFAHILHFCQLCYTKKISPVLYTLIDPSSIQDWLLYTTSSMGLKLKNSGKRMISNSTPSLEDSDHHSQKVSHRDEHLISTMLKIHESFDNNITRSNKEKEPGFKRLELHKKNLILNASAEPPYDTLAKEPSEFFKNFLQKKTQLKGKRISGSSSPN